MAVDTAEDTILIAADEMTINVMKEELKDHERAGCRVVAYWPGE